MIKLNSRQLNIVSPYRVENDGDALTFTTDNGLKYAVDFDEFLLSSTRRRLCSTIWNH